MFPYPVLSLKIFLHSCVLPAIKPIFEFIPVSLSPAFRSTICLPHSWSITQKLGEGAVFKFLISFHIVTVEMTLMVHHVFFLLQRNCSLQISSSIYLWIWKLYSQHHVDVEDNTESLNFWQLCNEPPNPQSSWHRPKKQIKKINTCSTITRLCKAATCMCLYLNTHLCLLHLLCCFDEWSWLCWGLKRH